MQYKKIMFFFSLALPISILLRFLQVHLVIDPKNGFYYPENEILGTAITVVLFLIVLMCVVFAFTSHRNPEQPPKVNMFLGVASVFMAGSILFETFFENHIIPVSNFQNKLQTIVGIICILFFLLLALSGFLKFSVPKFTYLIPCIYFILKIIREFTVISTIATISDNLLLMSAYASGMLFFLQYAKLYNDIDSELNFRKLLASALATVLFCFMESIPYFIQNFLISFEHTHISPMKNLGVFALGLFTFAFALSHYAKSNACPKK